MADTAKISIGGKTIDLPILKGTTGPDVVDIRKLYAESDAFTYDPGFTSTASCESKITFIDGDAASCCTAATRSANWPRNRTSWTSATCCCTANCRTPPNTPISST